VYRFFTPIIKVWVKGKKEPIAFETELEYNEWLNKAGNKDSVKQFKYYKGLGTSTPEDFKEYLSKVDEHLVQITMDKVMDGEIINLVFGKEDGATDKRKVWLDISADPIKV
jgi:DNA topoisomerase-2